MCAASPPDCHLRAALPADAAALHATCLPNEPLARVVERLTRIQKTALAQRGLGLVAVTPAGALVGFGQLTLWPRGAEISDLVVAPEWRGQGIGTLLIARLIDAAREMHAGAVEIGVAVRNNAALRLYHRLGFRPTRSLELDLGDGPEPVLYLSRTL